MFNIYGMVKVVDQIIQTHLHSLTGNQLFDLQDTLTNVHCSPYLVEQVNIFVYNLLDSYFLPSLRAGIQHTPPYVQSKKVIPFLNHPCVKSKYTFVKDLFWGRGDAELALVTHNGTQYVMKKMQYETQKAMKKEIQIMQSLQQTSFAPKYIEHFHCREKPMVGRATNIVYVVMEYVEGVNLQEYSREHVVTPELRAKIKQIISEVSNMGIHHGSLGPFNFLVGKGEHVYLVEYGLCKRCNEEDQNKLMDYISLRDTKVKVALWLLIKLGYLR